MVLIQWYQAFDILVVLEIQPLLYHTIYSIVNSHLGLLILSFFTKILVEIQVHIITCSKKMYALNDKINSTQELIRKKKIFPMPF